MHAMYPKWHIIPWDDDVNGRAFLNWSSSLMQPKPIAASCLIGSFCASHSILGAALGLQTWNLHCHGHVAS
jgi:hypothetical protein